MNEDPEDKAQTQTKQSILMNTKYHLFTAYFTK